MIEHATLAEARIVVIGLDDLTNAVIQDLVAFGAQHITVIVEPETESSHTFSHDSHVSVMHTTVQDLLGKDDGAALLRDSHFVLAANVPRPVELALGHLRGRENPERPLIIMRGKGNACKMRCQYRELRLLPSGNVTNFVALEDELPPWTDEKRNLVASTIQELVRTTDNIDKDFDNFKAYLTAAHAFVDEHEASSAWPTAAEYERVLARLPETSRSQQQDRILQQLGLAASAWSIRLLARIIAVDARRLLTGDGQPHNNTELQDVIRVADRRVSVGV
ncbi:hypothetical protein SEUCBS139899_008848 [Sporothrix eucalyptigena]|uniref:THIF-type NAD/FAD binding fold domain-containing protein n=1 Tax=Sporothrix eucalyptigena TaxID=1812306 RepID=A0ABP0CEY2_9PEZI